MLNSAVGWLAKSYTGPRRYMLVAVVLALSALGVACGSGITEEDLDTSQAELQSGLQEEIQALEQQISTLVAALTESSTGGASGFEQMEERLASDLANLAEMQNVAASQAEIVAQAIASQQQDFAEVEQRLEGELAAMAEVQSLTAQQAGALAEQIAQQQQDFEEVEQRLQAALANIGEQENLSQSQPPVSTANYEVWAMDQLNNEVYIINPQLEVVETLDLGAQGLKRIHWIDFTSDFKYVWLANTSSGNVAVMRAADREIVATFDTGPSSHAADILPDDSGVLVSVIGTGELIEITADHDTETFAIGRTLKLAEDPAILAKAADFGSTNPLEPPNAKPISSAFTADGKFAYVTLGPPLANGGLVIVDLESFSVVKAYPPAEVKTNLMAVLSADGTKMFVNGGSKDETSFVYVFDTTNHELIAQDSTRGADSHGMALTPDGNELWVTNRWTGNVAIFSTALNEFKERIPFVGVTPDLMAISPDGVYAFILLRGAQQEAGGAMAAEGETPGLVVYDVKSRKNVATLIKGVPSDTGVTPDLDYHGIAIRELN